ncbi:MAG: ATP-grasp domain-containing protein, partial [Halanaerobium sp. MSAO_Bac5]
PTARSLEIIQNKFHQKNILSQNKIPVAQFIKVSSIEDIKEAAQKFSYPLMLKSCTGGYDGKGNIVIEEPQAIKSSYQQLGGAKAKLMVEKYIPFKKEISVLACRALNGEMKVFPIAENLHKDNILYETKVPASLAAGLKEKAEKLAFEVLEVFTGIGMFCVEMFVTESDELLINEIAPRPHNSGHYTIEACLTSQFEQHIRAISSLPLGETTLLRPVVMRNILGSGSEGKAKVLGLEAALAVKGAKVHIYNKKMARPGRKMGHLCVLAENRSDAEKRALEASKLIEIKGEL